MLKPAGISRGNDLSVKVVTNKEELVHLKSAWDELASKQGAYFPYLCFDWYSLWLKHFLAKDRLFVLLLYKGNDLQAIAPLIKKEAKFRGVNIRKIELVGNVYSPFRYFILDRFGNAERKTYFIQFLDFLTGKDKSWDMIDFSAIPEEDDCFEVLLRAVVDSRLPYSEYLSFGDWYLDEIDYSGEEYIASRPKKIRKDVAYCQRRLKKMGDLEFKLVKDADLVKEYMDMYYDVYSRSWQEREGTGPTFHRGLARIAAKKDLLRLGFLLFQRTPIAAQFWINSYNTSYILKTVYDQEYRKYSPGKILTAEMMKYAIDVDKVHTVDYVQGDESYKQDWTPKRRERKGLLVFNNNLKGKYLAFLNNTVRPVVKKYRLLNSAKKVIKSSNRLRSFWL